MDAERFLQSLVDGGVRTVVMGGLGGTREDNPYWRPGMEQHEVDAGMVHNVLRMNGWDRKGETYTHPEKPGHEIALSVAPTRVVIEHSRPEGLVRVRHDAVNRYMKGLHKKK